MNNLKKVGILYQYDPNWIGGTIYVFNLLKALELARKEGLRLPEIVIFTSRFTKDKLDWSFSGLEYSVEFYDAPVILKTLNKVFMKLFRRVLIKRSYKYPLAALFPVNKPWEYFRKTPTKNQINWIPDFQCFHLPEYFENDDLEGRKNKYSDILLNAEKIVLSSNAVVDDLKMFFPQTNYPKLSVLHFAVFNEHNGALVNTPKFEKPYFICPNQFWAHKNQLLILMALQYLNTIDLPFYVVFTGKMFDPRNPSFYTESIEPLLNHEFIRNNIKMLGFIDRGVQIELIKNSLAIIQPSRFEGWSTVIEDGMYFNLAILASNLKVNMEQLGDKGQYFDPDDQIGLSKLMLEIFQKGKCPVNYNYQEKQKAFAEDFLKIINS